MRTSWHGGCRHARMTLSGYGNPGTTRRSLKWHEGETEKGRLDMGTVTVSYTKHPHNPQWGDRFCHQSDRDCSPAEPDSMSGFARCDEGTWTAVARTRIGAKGILAPSAVMGSWVLIRLTVCAICLPYSFLHKFPGPISPRADLP
jgi:hypothetical protein